MPENDRFERSLGPGWIACYRLAKAGLASDEEISDRLLKSLAKSLRENGGVLGLETLAQSIAGSGESSILDDFGAVDRIVRDCEGDRHTKVAADVAKSLLVQRDAGLISTEEAARQLYPRTCEALVDHRYFSRVSQRLISDQRFSSQMETRNWQSKVERAMQQGLEKIADQLSRKVNSEKLRAPNRTTKKLSTKELLRESLSVSPRAEVLQRDN